MAGTATGAAAWSLGGMTGRLVVAGVLLIGLARAEARTVGSLEIETFPGVIVVWEGVQLDSIPASGRITIGNIPAGRYHLELERNGQTIASRSIMIAPGHQQLSFLESAPSTAVAAVSPRADRNLDAQPASINSSTGPSPWAFGLLGMSPFRLRGSVSVGWFKSTARELGVRETQNVFSALKLDYSSFVVHPDFLAYSIRSQLSQGFQDSFVGTSPGTGFDVGGTFLRRRPWPFTFRYSRQSRSVLTTGLSASLARLVSNSDDSLLKLGWQLNTEDKPRISVDFSRTSSALAPDSGLFRGFNSDSRTFATRVQHNVRKWLVGGNFSSSAATSGVPDEGPDGGLLENQSDRSRASLEASRSLGEKTRFHFSLDRTTFDSQIGDFTSENTFLVARGRLDYRHTGKLRVNSRFGTLRSNLRTIFSDEAAGTTLPLTGQFQNEFLSAEARYQLMKSLSLVTRGEYSHDSSTNGNNRDGNLFNTDLGLSYSLSRKAFTLSGSYFVAGSWRQFSDQDPGRFVGHSADVALNLGGSDSIRVGINLGAHRNRDTVESLIVGRSSGERAGLTLNWRLGGNWSLGLLGDLRATRFERPFQESTLRTHSYGANLVGPRVSLRYQRSIGSGDGFQAILAADPFAPIPPDLLEFQLLESGFSTINAGASFRITRALSIRGDWVRQQQESIAALSTDYLRQEALVVWKLRKITVEAGHSLYRFDYGSPIHRRQWIFRITREFQLF